MQSIKNIVVFGCKSIYFYFLAAYYHKDVNRLGQFFPAFFVSRKAYNKLYHFSFDSMAKSNKGQGLIIFETWRA